MTFKGEISISQAISEMRGKVGQPFHLVFMRSAGKDKGEFKTVAKCLYGRSERRGVKHVGHSPAHKHPPLHTEHGTLPMTDYETGEYLTPLISHLVSFNLLRVRH